MKTGKYVVPSEDLRTGACPPMIIHSHQAEATNKSKSSTPSTASKKYSRDDEINVPSRFIEGLANPNAGVEDTDEIKNQFGFSVRSTKNGSMTQDTFYDWCLHFIKHLLEGQGKGGKGHILFLDGHASRWNLPALRLLMDSNVFPFFYLPTHQCGHNQTTVGAIYSSTSVLKQQSRGSVTPDGKTQSGFTMLSSGMPGTTT